MDLNHVPLATWCARGTWFKSMTADYRLIF
nr:MAG TPA_asm: hypothetical protein [Caudoviricetes sp.]